MFTRFVNRREARRGATRERDARVAGPFNRARVYFDRSFIVTDFVAIAPRRLLSHNLVRSIRVGYHASWRPLSHDLVFPVAKATIPCV